MDPFKNEIL